MLDQTIWWQKTDSTHVWRLMCPLQVSGFKMWMLTIIYATNKCIGKNIIKKKKEDAYTVVCRLCPSQNMLLWLLEEMSSRCIQQIISPVNKHKDGGKIEKKKSHFYKILIFACFASFGSFGINNNSGSLGTNKTSFLLKSRYSQLCSDSLLSPYSAAKRTC